MIPLPISNPNLIGIIIMDMVNPRIFLPVFHSPYTDVSTNRAPIIAWDAHAIMAAMVKMIVKLHEFTSIKATEK
jgi:hypothetical protein